MTRLLAALRRSYAQQLRLQQRHVARHELSGTQTAAAVRLWRGQHP